MEIKAIGSVISKKIKSPFVPKSTSSNPFENNSHAGTTFKGSVLPFADVFQTTKKVNGVNGVNKLKLVTASVVGAISDFGHKVSQPVVNFVNNVKAGYNNVVSVVKTIPNKVSETGRTIINNTVERLSFNKKTDSSTKILNMHQINTNASVQDLKTTWLEENRLLKEVKEAV